MIHNGQDCGCVMRQVTNREALNFNLSPGAQGVDALVGVWM